MCKIVTSLSPTPTPNQPTNPCYNDDDNPHTPTVIVCSLQRFLEKRKALATRGTQEDGLEKGRQCEQPAPTAGASAAAGGRTAPTAGGRRSQVWRRWQAALVYVLTPSCTCYSALGSSYLMIASFCGRAKVVSMLHLQYFVG